MPITKEDRENPKIAREVLEKLLPDAGVRKTCLRFLCDSIQLAHQLSPHSWGVTLTKWMVRLNVGRVEVLAIFGGLIHLVLHHNQEPQGLAKLNGVQINPKTRTLYRSVSGSFSCDIQADKAQDALPLVEESHHYLIGEAAKTARHSMTARSHSPGLLKYLAQVTGIDLPEPDHLSNGTVAFSALTFQAQFERFKAAVLKNSGEEFRSFREGLPLNWEGYKEHVRTRARTLLKLTQWKEGDIGTGRILDRVIRAIEINEGPDLRNNLVGWEPKYGPSKVPHRIFREAQSEKVKRFRVERAVYDLFQTDGSEEDIFENLQDLGCTHYEVLAYLFFLKDWNRFMPIRTKTFDAAFRDLGLDLTTTWQCSWENYCRYNKVLREVLVALRDVTGLEDVRLIDAHSFCWMLARLKSSPAHPGPTIPLPKVLSGLQAVIVQAGEPTTETEFDEVNEKQFFQREAERRRLGKLAQDVAIQSEQKRLREAGHPNPEAVIKPVWDEPGRGYDILSCEGDGTPRYIEVKAARRSGLKLSFFLTQNEWKQSRSKSNYCFYLVLKADSKRPVVLIIESGNVTPDCLAPMNYLASLCVPGD